MEKGTGMRCINSLGCLGVARVAECDGPHTSGLMPRKVPSLLKRIGSLMSWMLRFQHLMMMRVVEVS
jgi:hypothetical protein